MKALCFLNGRGVFSWHCLVATWTGFKRWVTVCYGLSPFLTVIHLRQPSNRLQRVSHVPWTWQSPPMAPYLLLTLKPDAFTVSTATSCGHTKATDGAEQFRPAGDQPLQAPHPVARRVCGAPTP